jgi:tetratricopeptide (TPR) repeat protein
MPVLALLVLALVFWSYKYTRIIAFGFLFFLVNIVLVLQFMSVGIALISERYTYIPYIGLFFIIGMGFSWIYRNTDTRFTPYKSLAIIAFIIITGICSYLSSERCKVWFNCDIMWTDVIKQFPDDGEAYKNRGGYLVEINKYDINPKPNDFDRAFNDFNIAIAMKPNDSKILSNRGNIFAIRGKYDLSLADYSKSIQLDSSDFNVYLNRGITYSIMDKYDSAFADWEKVLRIHGPEIKLYQNRAYAYIKTNKFKEAIDDYKSLTDMGIPLDANMYFFRAFAYYKLGNYDAAIDDNSKAIQMNPNYKEAIFNRGQTYYSMKKFKNAYDDIIKAQSLGYKIDQAFIDNLKKQL